MCILYVHMFQPIPSHVYTHGKPSEGLSLCQYHLLDLANIAYRLHNIITTNMQPCHVFSTSHIPNSFSHMACLPHVHGFMLLVWVQGTRICLHVQRCSQLLNAMYGHMYMVYQGIFINLIYFFFFLFPLDNWGPKYGTSRHIFIKELDEECYSHEICMCLEILFFF